MTVTGLSRNGRTLSAVLLAVGSSAGLSILACAAVVHFVDLSRPVLLAVLFLLFVGFLATFIPDVRRAWKDEDPQ